MTTDTPRTDQKKWCAYCGAWGDHQSGYCVPFLRDREVTLTHQLADARLEVERLREALKILSKMPEYDQDDAHRLRHKAKLALNQNDK